MKAIVSTPLIAVMVAGCSSNTTPTPQSFNRVVMDDGGGICPNPLRSKGGAVSRMVCADPPPDPFSGWDMQYTVGNDFTGLTFGGYYQQYPVAFAPTLNNCIGKTAHDLTADALALYTAALSARAAWANNAGAARFNTLMGDYAAGEIGALVFVWGS